MLIPEWPEILHREEEPDWRPAGRIVLPPESASGEQVPATIDDPWAWAATLSGIMVRTDDQRRALSALEARLNRGTAPVVVRRCAPRLVPWPVIGGVTVRRLESLPLPHSDGAYYSDGTGHVQSVVAARLEEAAAKGATTLRIRLLRSGPIRGGEVFSLLHPVAHWRLYAIHHVERSGDVATVQIPGGLWEATPAGQQVVFDGCRCTMRLSGPDAIGFRERLRREGVLSVSFTEASPRLVAAWRET